jgi:hypothetical protein
MSRAATWLRNPKRQTGLSARRDAHHREENIFPEDDVLDTENEVLSSSSRRKKEVWISQITIVGGVGGGMPHSGRDINVFHSNHQRVNVTGQSQPCHCRVC